MELKQKKCKGTTLDTKEYGCGSLQYNRKKGLGVYCGCWSSWLLNTEAGKEEIKKGAITAKKIVKKNTVEKDKAVRDSLKTKSDYEKILQKEINTIVRIIDEGAPCISSLRKIHGKYDAGHYFSVGSTPSLRFNLHNIYAQSVEQNRHKSGNPIGFMEGIKEMYGNNHYERVSRLRAKYKVIKLSIEEIKEATLKAREAIKRLRETKGRIFESAYRIDVRDYINEYIGIYG